MSVDQWYWAALWEMMMYEDGCRVVLAARALAIWCNRPLKKVVCANGPRPRGDAPCHDDRQKTDRLDGWVATRGKVNACVDETADFHAHVANGWVTMAAIYSSFRL